MIQKKKEIKQLVDNILYFYYNINANMVQTGQS